VRAALGAATASHAARLAGSLRRFFEQLRNELRGLTRALPTLDAILAMPRQKLDAFGERLPRALHANAHRHRVALTRTSSRLTPASLKSRIEHLKSRVGSLAKLVTAYSYHKVLDRGFALVRDAAGSPVRAAAALGAGEHIEIEFADGRVNAIAEGKGTARKAKPGTGSGGKSEKNGGQGGLFD
jgi:exodeoxyribonuclease VII large subunit